MVGKSKPSKLIFSGKYGENSLAPKRVFDPFDERWVFVLEQPDIKKSKFAR